MTRNFKHMNRYFYTLLLMATVALFASCGGHKGGHDDHDHEAEEAAGHHHGDEIILPANKAQAAGVRVETINKGDFHGVIHTSGKVMAASCDETTVVATISGRVSQSDHVSEGLHVTSGTRLYSITSAGMQAIDGDPVLRAKIDYEKAKRDYERACELIKDKIISEKDFQLAKADYEQTELTYTSLMRNRSTGGVSVTAPKSGYVKETLVKDGDYVEAGQPLMVLTQNQHLYLRAEVPEKHWKDLEKITCAKFRTSYSNRLFDITDMGGHIQSYGRSAETQSAYIPVIFEFNNTGEVVQGSYAEIYLITDIRKGVISIPLTALTEEQGIHYIYIKVDDDGYRKQEVKLGMSDGDRVEILSGLNGGEQVVVEGAVQVKLASASNAIPSHHH